MMCITLSITQHDNKVCFNWTVGNIKTLSSRKFNVPDKIYSMVAKTKTKTIQYHVTTIHGQSDEYYKHHKKHPVHGPGQGPGNAGLEWIFITIPIIKTFEQKAE